MRRIPGPIRIRRHRRPHCPCHLLWTPAGIIATGHHPPRWIRHRTQQPRLVISIRESRDRPARRLLAPRYPPHLIKRQILRPRYFCPIQRRHRVRHLPLENRVPQERRRRRIGIRSLPLRRCGLRIRLRYDPVKTVVPIGRRVSAPVRPPRQIPVVIVPESRHATLWLRRRHHPSQRVVNETSGLNTLRHLRQPVQQIIGIRRLQIQPQRIFHRLDQPPKSVPVMPHSL